MRWDYLLAGLAVCAGCTVGVVVLGRLLLRAIGDSPARQAHGRFVYWWTVAGTAVSIPLFPFAAPDPGAFFGWPMFCMLAGWLIGSVHGGLVLLWRWAHGRAPEE